MQLASLTPSLRLTVQKLGPILLPRIVGVGLAAVFLAGCRLRNGLSMVDFHHGLASYRTISDLNAFTMSYRAEAEVDIVPSDCGRRSSCVGSDMVPRFRIYSRWTFTNHI